MIRMIVLLVVFMAVLMSWNSLGFVLPRKAARKVY